MDNALIKKDSIIAGLKKKFEKNYDDDKYCYEKEIHVIEPTVAVTQIHDELLLYKQIYETLATHIKEKADSLARYEQVINDLQNENSKMRTQIKLHLFSESKQR